MKTFILTLKVDDEHAHAMAKHLKTCAESGVTCGIKDYADKIGAIVFESKVYEEWSPIDRKELEETIEYLREEYRPRQ